MEQWKSVGEQNELNTDVYVKLDDDSPAVLSVGKGIWRHGLLLHMDTMTAGHPKETHDRPAAECCSENYVPRLIVTNSGWDPCRWRKS